MRKGSNFLLLSLLAALAVAVAPARANAALQCYPLIPAEMLTTVNSAEGFSGQVFQFKTTATVSSNGFEFPSGTLGYGVVLNAIPASNRARNGIIVLEPRFLLVNGQEVQIAGDPADASVLTHDPSVFQMGLRAIPYRRRHRRHRGRQRYQHHRRSRLRLPHRADRKSAGARPLRAARRKVTLNKRAESAATCAPGTHRTARRTAIAAAVLQRQSARRSSERKTVPTSTPIQERKAKPHPSAPISSPKIARMADDAVQPVGLQLMSGLNRDQPAKAIAENKDRQKPQRSADRDQNDAEPARRFAIDGPEIVVGRTTPEDRRRRARR